MSGPGQGRWEVMPAHPEQVPGCGKGAQVNPWGGKKKIKIFFTLRSITVNLTHNTRDRGGYNAREMVLT